MRRAAGARLARARRGRAAAPLRCGALHPPCRLLESAPFGTRWSATRERRVSSHHQRGLFARPETTGCGACAAHRGCRKARHRRTFLELDLDPHGQFGQRPPMSAPPQDLVYLRWTRRRHWPWFRGRDRRVHKSVFKARPLYAGMAVLRRADRLETAGRAPEPHSAGLESIRVIRRRGSCPGGTDDTLVRSDDEGESWRPTLRGDGSRLALPEPERSLAADGTVEVSEDGGERFDRVFRFDVEPTRSIAAPSAPRELVPRAERRYIVHSDDAARVGRMSSPLAESRHCTALWSLGPSCRTSPLLPIRRGPAGAWCLPLAS